VIPGSPSAPVVVAPAVGASGSAKLAPVGLERDYGHVL